MSEYTNNPYLTFIGEEKDFTLTATNKGWTGTLEYSTNKINWYVWDGSAIQSAGLLLYLRGKGNNRLYNVRLVLSERAGCYGNINVLLDYENPFPESLPSIGGNFYYLFGGCTNLIAAPELPAMRLRDSCYNNMFNGTSITEPPELPATTLDYACYYSMFYNCQQLKRAPELPAIVLKPSSYYRMFYNCKSLKQPPSKLPATEAATSCYYNMFESCTSLQTLPKIYLTKLANYCMNGMFYRCSKLAISTTKTGEYIVPWRFPTIGTVDSSTTSSTDWNHAIFNGLYNNIEITLSPNTVYYLKSPATEQQLFSRICLKGDTYANWTSSNPILKKNEVAIYTDTKGLKVGDGTTKVASLPYFLSSNAATATKLQTPRNITLETAVTATVTKFDGSANITVPVTEVKESYLTWGGKDYAGGFGPLDAALIGDLSINRLAGLPESQWKFERSSDAGATWTEYTGPVGMNIGTVINPSSTPASNANTKDSQSVNNWHRITIDVVGYIYCELRKIALYFTTNGASGCKCKIEWGDKSTPTVWTTEKETAVNGWSGWNIIQVNKTIGGSAASYPRYIRLTFSQTGLNSNYSSSCSVSSIRFYAQNCWSAVGDIGLRGTPYQFNKDQEVTFKNSISVPNGSINTGGQVYAVGNVNGKNVYAKESMQAPTITATTSVTAPKFIGDAQGVTGIAGTKNVARRVWFSDADYETRRDYDDDFKYNPYSNTLSVDKITGSARDLRWSNISYHSNYTLPNDVALVPEFFANRFACYDSQYITVEHSKDGGTTWTTSTADSEKVSSICTMYDGIAALYIGGENSANTNTNWRTRITFDKIPNAYYIIRKFFFETNSAGHSAYATIEYYKNNTWTVFGSGTIAGNIGVNVINPSTEGNNFILGTYGADKLRMTFEIKTLHTTPYGGFKIQAIKVIGEALYQQPKYMPRYGTPYFVDRLGNAKFQNEITAPQITVSNDPVNNTDATNKAYVDEKSKLYLHSITYTASNSNDGYSSEGVINLYTKSSTEITDFFEIYNAINTATSTSIAGFINGPLGINIARRFNIAEDGSSMWIYAILNDGSIDSINVDTIDSIFDNVVEIL